MSVRKRCVICGRAITERFHVCMHCITTHNIPYAYRDWPRWVKALVNIELKNLKLLREEEGQIPINDGDHDTDMIRRF